MSLEHSPARGRRTRGRTRRKNITEIFEATYSVDEFCEAENVSRSRLYEFWQMGLGPDYYMNGNQRRITHDARRRWQQARIAATREVA
jgi:hypothetical protein